jgi:hypothetical protein
VLQRAMELSPLCHNSKEDKQKVELQFILRVLIPAFVLVEFAPNDSFLESSHVLPPRSMQYV